MIKKQFILVRKSIIEGVDPNLLKKEAKPRPDSEIGTNGLKKDESVPDLGTSGDDIGDVQSPIMSSPNDTLPKDWSESLKSANDAAQLLSEVAFANGSMDNISIIVVTFPQNIAKQKECFIKMSTY